MKATKMIKPAVVGMLLIMYLYIVIKIILFKFGHVDAGFMFSQLMMNLDSPGHILRQLQDRANLVPFHEISDGFSNMTRTRMVNLVGNIAIFMPLGILLPLLFGNRKMFFNVMLVAVLFSLSLETAQLVLSMGTFDVDDLILNTSGALLGYVLYTIFSFGRSEVRVAKTKEKREPQVGH
ncbi:VanZ family protein [Paenibacillus pini]|uniref:Teicoplanin resistance protein vanZ n=1 Tax=Paenibacillus pini JCM 16418 TaxID=1236976 RepID=W7YV18_9BACL|nr:VanZ family protein [Paenibacillus pini]GAF08436.1 teicoplanin resistance protein vanZ [Paenibacillus pini JCM 16418]